MNRETYSRGRLPGSNANYAKRWFGRALKRKKIFNKTTEEDSEAKKAKKSTSSNKILDVEVEASDTSYRFIDVSILYSKLEELICCSKCKNSIQIFESGFRGLAFNIDLHCTTCEEVHSINSTKKVGPKKNATEVNRRSVLAARALGHGLAGLETFCGIMDLPPPVNHSAFDAINKHLNEVCQMVAEASMKAAVQKEIKATVPSKPGLDVSGDGSWRKRGFSSLQGITSIIGHHTSQVLDVSIKNSYCRSCSQWANKKGSSEYEEWYASHILDCPANHEGSAGKMEVDGVLDMFLRSVEKHGVRYQNYIGDGDSKVYHAMQEIQPYGEELLVQKKECVGHVQKRMGTRLRNLKKKLGKELLSDGKSIGGKGRLTGQKIDLLTIYYGMAIRNNSDNVKKMHQAIWASFYHKRSTDEEPQHHLCPEGEGSWCTWHLAKAAGKVKTFRHKGNIPPAVMDAIKTEYEELTNLTLLERCLGGFTQNNNESFNNSVWKLVPKTSFSGLTVLEIGVYIAVVCFNDGKTGFVNIMQHLEVHAGTNALN